MSERARCGCGVWFSISAEALAAAKAKGQLPLCPRHYRRHHANERRDLGNLWSKPERGGRAPKAGDRLFLCDECGAGTWFLPLHAYHASRPKCRLCGSLSLTPSDRHHDEILDHQTARVSGNVRPETATPARDSYPGHRRVT